MGWRGDDERADRGNELLVHRVNEPPDDVAQWIQNVQRGAPEIDARGVGSLDRKRLRVENVKPVVGNGDCGTNGVRDRRANADVAEEIPFPPKRQVRVGRGMKSVDGSDLCRASSCCSWVGEGAEELAEISQ